MRLQLMGHWTRSLLKEPSGYFPEVAGPCYLQEGYQFQHWSSICNTTYSHIVGLVKNAQQLQNMGKGIKCVVSQRAFFSLRKYGSKYLLKMGTFCSKLKPWPLQLHFLPICFGLKLLNRGTLDGTPRCYLPDLPRRLPPSLRILAGERSVSGDGHQGAAPARRVGPQASVWGGRSTGQRR